MFDDNMQESPQESWNPKVLFFFFLGLALALLGIIVALAVHGTLGLIIAVMGGVFIVYMVFAHVE